jgi:tetratricopeptide (TPR) repeat protein
MWRSTVYAVLWGALFVLLPEPSASQEAHNHPAPEKLGTVAFPVSCAPAVQKEFERAVALLHSFAYSAAEASFGDVAARDPHCAMAHWGIAMTHFHQLWEPPLPPEGFPLGQQEVRRAQEIGVASDREGGFIHAMALVYDNTAPYQTRIVRYEAAMQKLAAAYRDDAEVQVFYALALVAAASPFDKTHARQKQAVEILEPLYSKFPQHPGIAHYMIHAYDNAELAGRGAGVARAYAKIAPSAPHALHMPSHIFTRLGMWSDSIASNRAARAAAHDQGDTGEELHAMDYLVYAYLQEGRDREAAEIIQQLGQMQNLKERDFKAAYASTAMPVRYALERHQWAEAARIESPQGAPPHVAAIAAWARAMGLARSGRPAEVRPEIDRLHELERPLRAAGNEYWAQQVRIQAMEAEAWLAQAEGRPDDAERLLRSAADEEDAIEKLPVTPGPIIPAREQLGDLLPEQHRPDQAVKEFRNALASAPNRRGSLDGLSRATGQSRRM